MWDLKSRGQLKLLRDIKWRNTRKENLQIGEKGEEMFTTSLHTVSLNQDRLVISS